MSFEDNAALYSTVSALESTGAGSTIFPLQCYPHLYGVVSAAVSLHEIRGLSRSLPVVFERQGHHVRAIAIIGLPGAQNLLARAVLPDALPLILRAFPLALGGRSAEGHVGILINDPPSSAGHPGLPAFLDDGSMSRTLIEKSDALWLYAATQERSLKILRDLDERQAFETWPLRLTFDDRTLEVSNLMRISSSFLQSPGYRDLIAIHGFEIAGSLHYHRMSLGMTRFLQEGEVPDRAASA